MCRHQQGKRHAEARGRLPDDSLMFDVEWKVQSHACDLTAALPSRASRCITAKRSAQLATCICIWGSTLPVHHWQHFKGGLPMLGSFVAATTNLVLNCMHGYQQDPMCCAIYLLVLIGPQSACPMQGYSKAAYTWEPLEHNCPEKVRLLRYS